MVYTWVYHARGFQYDIMHLQSMSTDWHPGGVLLYGEYNTLSYSSNESSCLCKSCVLLYLFMTRSNTSHMQVFWNRATPSHHPFLDRFSHEINCPAIGVPSCYEISWYLFTTRNKPNHFLGTPKQMVNGRGQSPDDDLEQQDDRWIRLLWGDASTGGWMKLENMVNRGLACDFGLLLMIFLVDDGNGSIIKLEYLSSNFRFDEIRQLELSILLIVFTLMFWKLLEHGTWIFLIYE